jgi:hypothetical protein
MTKDLNIVSRVKSKIEKIVPDASLISIEDICIGRVNPLDYYSFGFSAHNKGNKPLKILFRIDQVDREKYTIEKYVLYGEIKPNEKRRFWSSFHEKHKYDLKNYFIREIVIYIKQNKEFTIIFSTHPNKSVLHLFNAYGEKSPLKIILIIFIITISYIIISNFK